jgi:ComF family protein
VYHRHPADNDLVARLRQVGPVSMAAAAYFYEKDAPLSRAIHAFKYYHRWNIVYQLGRIYGRQLADERITAGNPVVVDVPLHRRKLAIRGYNQAAWFGRGIAHGAGLRAQVRALRRRRFTQSQARLSGAERAANVAGAFVVTKKLPSGPVILVDDVITTGGTMAEAALALQQAGVQDIRALALAVAETS